VATVELRSITKSFDDVRVLNDINLAIQDKEFIVFVGPSGCGKSTLLRIIAGLEEATSGAILIGGDDVSTAHPIDRGISMVFQSYALYPHLTVYENIAFPLRVQKMDKNELNDQVEAMTMADRIVVLNGGYVEQLGTPMELYHHPATKFVAQFNGQPNMNLIPMDVIDITGDGLGVRFPSGYEMTVPVDTSGVQVGDQVEVGIRPEDVALTNGEGLVVSVDVLERLGGISITYGRTSGGDQKFCASLAGDAEILEGRDITLSINASDCHVFDVNGHVLRRL
jgi:ABC-type sugar transport system ATPase subunit